MSTPFGAPLEVHNDDAGTYQGEPVGTPKEVPWWEEDGAPAGSHQGSLFVTDEAGRKHVAGPTHFHHLADGRVVAGYSGGTVHSEPGPNGRDKLTRIIGTHEG